MTKDFHISAFIDHVARELVTNFGASSMATTPGLIGTARESEVRHKLASLLPKVVSVGSGCVVDSYGNTSKQIDIIIYERELCPVYSLNEADEVSYYPCEGVIAVGEIKSTLDKNNLGDGFSKIESVKRLKRRTLESTDLNGRKVKSFRSYCQVTTMFGLPEEGFNQELNFKDQIFGFILSGTMNMKRSSFLKNFSDFNKKTTPDLAPNFALVLDSGVLGYFKEPVSQMAHGASDDPTCLYLSPGNPNVFKYLLYYLYKVITNCRTVSTDVYEHYLYETEKFGLQRGGDFQEL